MHAQEVAKSDNKRALRRAFVAYLKHTDCLDLRFNSGVIVSIEAESEISPSTLNAMARGDMALVKPLAWPIRFSQNDARRWLAQFACHQAQQANLDHPILIKATALLAKAKVSQQKLTYCLQEARGQRKESTSSGSPGYHLAFGIELLCHHLLEPHIGIGLGASLMQLQVIHPASKAWQFEALKEALIECL